MWGAAAVLGVACGFLATPAGFARFCPLWLGLVAGPPVEACAAPLRASAALARGELVAADAWRCRHDVVGGPYRRAALDARLSDRRLSLAGRREIARLLLATGDAAALLADPRLGVDLRRGLVDADTIAHADDDLVALAALYPLGGAQDNALVAEALATGDATSAAAGEPLELGLPGATLLRGLPRLPASSPPVPTIASYLSDYGPIGEALAEHVFAEWAAVRAWVAAGSTDRDRADRAMAVLVANPPGEPRVSVHALVRGERVTPALMVLAALDLGGAATLPVSVRGDEHALVIGVGHRAVYAPACGPRRAVALPGTRVDPDWGPAPAEIAAQARRLSDTWGLGPCENDAVAPG
ncbi:MAG: hypothetical protein FJ090_21665 [Deltaproteobacteria bacterium]|nr:hypothetical protein [Deltaproteobacteria bacterium]